MRSGGVALELEMVRSREALAIQAQESNIRINENTRNTRR